MTSIEFKRPLLDNKELDHDHYFGEADMRMRNEEDEDNKFEEAAQITYVGKLNSFTEKVFEELTDEQDHFEAFFTSMFVLGIVFIPLSLIFSDYIKYYDKQLIIYLQSSSFYHSSVFNYLSSFINLFYTVKFHVSFCIFAYLALDPGVAYKVAITAGFTSYLCFYLEVIIHDPRPYWITTEIIPAFCHVNFGCPSLNILSGFMYYQLLNLNYNRAIHSRDPFTRDNITAMKCGVFIAKFFIVINFLVGLVLIANGENFVYQVIVSFFFGFIFIRILITFNKDIDYLANGARYIMSISNQTVVWFFIYIMGLASASWIVYSIIHKGLLISKENMTNINVSHVINY